MKNNNFNKGLKRYYQKINKALVCPKDVRDQTLNSIRNGVENFINENPDADLEQIVERFGSPERIAKEVLAVMDPHDIAEYTKKMRITSILKLILVVFLIGILIWYISIFVMRTLYAAQETVTIIVDSPYSVASIPPKPVD